MELNRLSPYERQSIKQIRAWKSPKTTSSGQLTKVLNWPFSKTGDLVVNAPVVGDAIRKAVGGTVSVCNDLAQWTVRPNKIYGKFRDTGFEVHNSDDLISLDLKDIDKVVGFLDGKYKALAGIEGATTGATGAIGLIVDVPTLVALNLRAIGEYATYYGFDVSQQQERLYALNVLGLASSPEDGSKQVLMSELVKVAKDVALRKTWRTLEEHTFVRIVRRIARTLGMRLTKAKLAQLVPIVGAAVGLGFNAYFTAKVCESSHQLYRERYLASKYGSAVFDDFDE